MTALPLTVGQPRSIRLIEDAVLMEPRIIGLVASKDPEIEEPSPTRSIESVPRCMLHRLHKTPDGIILFVQGMERIRIDEYTTTTPYLKARVTPIPEEVEKIGRDRSADAQPGRAVSAVGQPGALSVRRSDHDGLQRGRSPAAGLPDRHLRAHGHRGCAEHCSKSTMSRKSCAA